MADRFSKLSKAISTTKTTSTSVGTIIFEHGVSNVDIPTKLLTDNGPLFTSTFFPDICTELDVERISTTEYHSQSNVPVELINQTIAFRLRHYMVEHRKGWDISVLPLTFAYNVQVDKGAKLPACNLFFTRKRPGPATICPPTVAGT